MRIGLAFNETCPVAKENPANSAGAGIMLKPELEQSAYEDPFVATSLDEEEPDEHRLFEENHSIILLINPLDGRIVDANPAACRFYGYRRRVIRKMNICQINTLPAEQIQEKLLLAEKEVQNQFHFKHRLANGTVRDVLVFSSPVDHGASKVLFSVIQDITKIHHQAEQDNLQKLEWIGSFAAGITHDLNNRLAEIMAASQLIGMKIGGENDIAKYLDHIQSTCMETANFLRRLSAFSDQGEPSKQPVCLEEWLPGVIAAILSDKAIRHRIDFMESLWQVLIDAEQMGQAVNGLVTHVVQTMPQGGMVEVRAENCYGLNYAALPDGRYVKITIRDHGGGIPEAELPQIFDPFHPTQPFAKGLDLTAAFYIIKKHGGHIQVASRVDWGTTFAMFLPTIE